MLLFNNPLKIFEYFQIFNKIRKSLQKIKSSHRHLFNINNVHELIAMY